jgi:hypothetical protein
MQYIKVEVKIEKKFINVLTENIWNLKQVQ